MPLARILTLRPEEVTGLYEQLQQLGFDVEVSNPHDRNLATADLEIEFAICDQQQVLGRAAAIANQLQAEVVVFPGALPPIPKPVVIEEVPVSVPEPVEMEPSSLPAEVLVQEEEQEPVLATAAQDSGEQIRGVPWTVSFAEALRKSGRGVATAAGFTATKMRSGLLRLKPVLASIVLKFKKTTSAAGTVVADRTREYQERMKARSSQSQAARSQRLVQMERLKAEAREQVAVLERARMAAEAQHQQLQRLDEEQPVRPREARAAGRRMLQLKGVFAGAVAAAALFIVGIVLANVHAHSPIPRELTGNHVQEQVPFGPANAQGAPGLPLGPITGKTLAARAVVTPSPARQLATKVASSRPAIRAHATQARNHKTEWRHFRNKSNGEEDDVAQDVVVRHFGPPRKPTTQTAQRQDGIKRYSDQ